MNAIRFLVRRARGFFPLAALAAAACDVPPEGTPATDVEPVTRAVLEGTPTDHHPEIGKIVYTDATGRSSLCTGTLIERLDHQMISAVLTAAHCVGFSRASPQQYRFHINGEAFGVNAIAVLPPASASRIESADAQAAYFHKVRQLSPDRAGNNDLAILFLARWVPWWVATPATIATSLPADGAPFTIVGYGDFDRVTEIGAGTKRYITYPYRQPASFGSDAYRDTEGRGHVATGDSGGPALVGNLTDRQDGRLVIWGVNSAGSGLADWFANAVHNRNWIQPALESCWWYPSQCWNLPYHDPDITWVGRCDDEGVAQDLYRSPRHETVCQGSP